MPDLQNTASIYLSFCILHLNKAKYRFEYSVPTNHQALQTCLHRHYIRQMFQLLFSKWKKLLHTQVMKTKLTQLQIIFLFHFSCAAVGSIPSSPLLRDHVSKNNQCQVKQHGRSMNHWKESSADYKPVLEIWGHAESSCPDRADVGC